MQDIYNCENMMETNMSYNLKTSVNIAEKGYHENVFTLYKNINAERI